MQGVEVIFGPMQRRVWRADGFYLEQDTPPGGKLGDVTSLVIARKPKADYKPWDPDDPETHEAPTEATRSIRPGDVMLQEVLARIPTGRYCFVHLLELDEQGTAPARTHIETGWELPETKAEHDPKEPLPRSEVGPDRLPMSPRRTAAKSGT